VTHANKAENKAEEVVSQGHGDRRECADSTWLLSRNASLIAYLPGAFAPAPMGYPLVPTKGRP
jgi:hypothetical protein